MTTRKTSQRSRRPSLSSSSRAGSVRARAGPRHAPRGAFDTRFAPPRRHDTAPARYASRLSLVTLGNGRRPPWPRPASRSTPPRLTPLPGSSPITPDPATPGRLIAAARDRFGRLDGALISVGGTRSKASSWVPCGWRNSPSPMGCCPSGSPPTGSVSLMPSAAIPMGCVPASPRASRCAGTASPRSSDVPLWAFDRPRRARGA